MPKKIQLKNAVIYARFSSSNQREESIEQQVAECRDFAEKSGYKIIGIYADSAMTGRTDRRPQFQKLQRDAKKNMFSCVIAYKSNRVARNLLNALTFENEMNTLGIEVLYAKEEFGDNPAGRFALRMMMNVNQFYSENMGEDIKRNQAANAQLCKSNGPTSYGYRAGADGRFEIDEDTAPIVLEIFTRVAAGELYIEIANDLNRRGIKTGKGGLWNKSSFASILRNEKYMGIYIYDNVRIEGGMPAIVSKELFLKVSETVKNRKASKGRNRENGDYLLTGKLFCGKCGTHMVGMSGTSENGAAYYYYVCNDKRLNGSCDKKNVKRDYIETEIARAIRDYILSEETMKWIADTTMAYQRALKNSSEIVLLKDQITDVEKSIKNLLSAIEMGIITDSTKSRLIELEGKKAELDAQFVAMDAERISVTREQVIEYLESFRAGDLTDKSYKKSLFNQFLRAVYLYDNGKTKVVFDLFGDSTKNIECLLGDSEEVRTDSPMGHHKKRGKFPWEFASLFMKRSFGT